jgi:hypothetical protein
MKKIGKIARLYAIASLLCLTGQINKAVLPTTPPQPTSSQRVPTQQEPAQEEHTSAPLTLTQQKNGEHWIIIAIHGTFGLDECGSPPLIFTLFKDIIDGTIYKKRVCSMRGDCSRYHSQAMQEPGLIPIKLTDSPQTPAELFAMLYDTVQQAYYPERQATDYYTFGWSGLLNGRERFEEAIKLMKGIKGLVAIARAQGIETKIGILAYSHGANVALDLTEVQRRALVPVDFVIDELSMLGPPVQRETDCYINRPFIKKIYNFNSLVDRTCRLDCFSTSQFFSGRRFYDNARCKVPDKLTQVELRCSIPAAQDQRRTYKSLKRIHYAPGHYELWHFGWPGVNDSFRQYFPLVPLPAVLLIPAFTATLAQHLPAGRDCIFEIRPDNGTACLRKRHHSEKIIVPCIDPALLSKLKKQAWDFFYEHADQLLSRPKPPPEENPFRHPESARMRARSKQKKLQNSAF